MTDNAAFELLTMLTTQPLGFEAIKAELGFDDMMIRYAIRECQRMKAGICFEKQSKTVFIRPAALRMAQLRAEAYLERTYN